MPGFEVLGDEEKEEILDVLSRKVLFRYEFDQQREGIYKVEAFEKAFARYCGVNHALAVSSGSAALKVALSALGIGPGDEVITQGFTFVATWEAIFETGAVPVFAEIDDTLCLDPEDITNKISSRTKAVIPHVRCPVPDQKSCLGCRKSWYSRCRGFGTVLRRQARWQSTGILWRNGHLFI